MLSREERFRMLCDYLGMAWLYKKWPDDYTFTSTVGWQYIGQADGTMAGIYNTRRPPMSDTEIEEGK